MNGGKTLSTEEADLVQRSSKKVKRKVGDNHEQDGEVEMVEAMDTDLLVGETRPPTGMGENQVISYSAATKGGGARHRTQEVIVEEEDLMSDDDLVDNEEEDENCPVILLSKEEKERLRRPWKQSLIIKLFDKRLSYAMLIRRLRLMWSLKGEIALTDVGCA